MNDNLDRSTNAEILARRDFSHYPEGWPILNSRCTETLLTFVQYNESGEPNYISRTDVFNFSDGEQAPMTCTLKLALFVVNRLDNLPDYILEYCEKHDFIPKEVTIEYCLIDS